MKIGDTQPATGEVNLDSEGVDSSREADREERASAFSKLLARKCESNKDSGSSKSGQRAGDFASIMSAFLEMPKAFDQSMRIAEAEGKHVVALPPELQELVREISVVVNTPGVQQVHIELNSSVLKGLHIRIDRQDGAVSILFQCASQPVASLLSRNVAALSQGLADRGVTVADIRVSSPRDTAASRNNKGGNSRPGGRGQSGRQGGRR